MTSLKTAPISDDLPFGAQVWGVGWDTMKDEAARKQILEIFEDRGLIVFKDLERSTQLQVELSKMFGPLQTHPLKAIARVDEDSMPGVIDINVRPEDCSIVEMNGKQLSCWAPWHFDNAYTKHLCRAAILRGLIIPPDGGMTGFADGIQLYKDISPELRDKFENLRIIYDAHLLLDQVRFGMPKDWRFIRIDADGRKLLESTENSPRSVHPAIWQRASGEKILHVSIQNAAGIFGHEDPEGDALLEALCQEMQAVMKPYWHKYEPNDMVVFDNWRFVHTISGNDPQYQRRMHRTTIEGDYGLGIFEHEALATA